MKTLLVAICHPGAQAQVDFNGPTWAKAESDLACIEHADKPAMMWPDHKYVGRVGTDREKTRFGPVDRTIEVMQWVLQLRHEVFPTYDQVCFIEPDVVMLRPIPSCLDGVGGPCLLGTHSGFRSPPYLATRYFHCPWVVPWSKMATLYDRAQRMVEHGLGESGWTDRWFGLVGELYPELEMYHSGNYSQNALDQPHFIREAREAMKRPDCWAIHGVKTKAQFDALML
jgi:hypothetical protein